MFVFELLAEWIFTSLVYGVFAARRARHRYRRALQGEPVSVPGRLQILPGVPEPIDVKLHLSQGTLSAEKTMGQPGTYELKPVDSEIEVNDMSRDKKPWKSEPAIVFQSPSGKVSLFCRPQDLPLLTLALGRPILKS